MTAEEVDATLARVLPAGSLFSVGGRVRDEERAKFERVEEDRKDLDYVVTGVSPDDLQRRLESIARVDLVGASFAVYKVTLDGATVDVALPRRERSTGPLHRDFDVYGGAGVKLEEDLARRDFRMNALARAVPSGEIVDPCGGVRDIETRRIDIISGTAFEEDPLRMLRAAQFAARFEYELTPRTAAAMKEAAGLASSISSERVAEEVTKLLVRARRPSIGFEILRSTGVLGVIAPELIEGVGVEQNEWHAFDVWHHAMATIDAAPAGDLVLRLAALLHDVGKPRTKQGPHFYRHEQVGADMAVELLRRMRFSNEIVGDVSHLVRNHMYAADPNLSDAALRRSIRRIGPHQLHRQFALRHADIAGSGLPKRDGANEAFEHRVEAELARKPAFSIADLKVDGEDIVASMIRHGTAPRGFRGDERVGVLLQRLFEQVTDEPERNEREKLLSLLDEYLASDAS